MTVKEVCLCAGTVVGVLECRVVACLGSCIGDVLCWSGVEGSVSWGRGMEVRVGVKKNEVGYGGTGVRVCV